MKHTLVFHLIGLSKKLQGSIGQKAENSSLSYSQAAALLITDSQKAVSQAEIASKTNLKPASIVTLVDQLEKRGLVERKHLSNNRRQYRIELTDKGKQEIRSIKNSSKDLDSYLQKNLPAQELNSFMETMEKIAKVTDDWQKENTVLKNKREEVKNELSRTKRYVAP